MSCHTADSKLVKQEVNGTVIHPPLAFPAAAHVSRNSRGDGEKCFCNLAADQIPVVYGMIGVARTGSVYFTMSVTLGPIL